MSVLLMTATINSGYFGNISTKIKDTEERKKQYENALTNYILHSKFDKIVFADNSNEHLNESYFCDLADKYGKALEFLEFPGNCDRMRAQGKSYGEAALILEAMKGSKLISGEPSVYKVTGRIWIENINKLINDRTETCFVAHNFKSWVLTSFFKINIEEFWETLSSAHELCNDNTEDFEWCIEHAYYVLLKNSILPIHSIIPYPDMRGINSGSGGFYTKTKKQLFIRNALTLLGFYRFNPNRQFYYPLLSLLERLKHR